MDSVINGVLPSLSELIQSQGQYFTYGLALGMFAFLLAFGIASVISLLR